MNKTVKWLLAASRFAIGVMLIFTSGNVLAYGNKTVKAYVAQENLFAHYDGIANAGYSEENGDIHNASATTWKNVVSVGADANEYASKTGTITVKDRYMSFATAGAKAYYTADLAQLKTAFNNKALTVQLFFRALSYKQYAGFLGFWDNGSRYLLFDQREDNTYVSNGAFGGLQYASSKWTSPSSCCPKVYTKDYINKDVLITITVDGKGAHLIIDDGDVVHTNPGSNVAAALSKVKLGAAGNSTCAKMYLYAVRFYNKVLSKEEIATNLAIDRERFLGIGLTTTVACSATDSETELSFDGETWQSSIVADDVVNASTVTIKARNSGFERVHFAWSGLPSGATFLDESKSQVQFKNPPEDLEITCKAARLDFSATAADENTELSFDGENWDSTIQLSNVFANSNVTVYARNVSEEDHAYFTWGNLPAGAVMNNTDNSSISFDIPVAESQYSISCSSMASDELNIWTGGSGNFEDAAKWSLGVVPGANSIVILPNKTSAYTVTVNSPLDIGELIVGGGEGKGYPAVNFKTTSSKNYTKPTLNVVSGDVVVKANATITHNRNEQSSSFYKVAIKCRNLTVEKNAKISADEKGSYNLDPANNPSSTPGHVGNNSYGGTGGLVDKNHNLSDKLCWGSIREPYEIGSAGTAANIGNATFLAGGAVYLEVEDDAIINGTVSAVSKKDVAYYNGSGGSIYIKAGNLTGAGVIDASAGKVTSQASGGGGRISVRLNKATSFEGFTGTITAYASYANVSKSTMVGCGTIYLEHAGDVADQGQLTVDNGTTGTPYNQYAAVLLNSYVRDRATPFGEVVVKNGANLRLPSGCVLKITKKLKTTGANLYALEGSKVEFVGEEDAVIEGKNSFYSFSCTVPGKKLIFGAGPDNRTTIKENGYFSIIGTEEKPIEIRSSEDGVQCEFALQAGVNQIDANQVNNKNVNLKDVNATFGATSIAITGGEAENCDGCAVATKPKPGDVIVWNGSVSVDWTESSNWDRKRLPIATDVVVIPGDCQNYPTVETDIVLNSFSNLVGGCINMSGANMTVTNAFANLGTLTTKDNDILYLSGDGLTEADFGLSSYTNVYVTKTAGGVNFVNGLKTRYFRCVNEAPIALSFGAGKLFKTEQLVLADAEANELTSPGLELKSIVPGEKWLLDTTENYIVKGLKISDCAFTGETDEVFKVGALAVDNGGNSKIDFAESAAAFWSNGALTTAESWMPALLPQASTHVMIAPYAGKTATLSANSQIQYGNLVVGGLGGSATVTLSKKYSLNGGLAINRLGTVKSDYFSSPNEIAGNIWITRGGVLSHSAHVKDDGNTEKYKVSIDVDGDLTINAGAIINVKGCGFYTGNGPGKSTKAYDGSSYASVGVNAWGTNGNGPPKRCYGSILSPFSLGSAGGYGTGGGAVRLNSKGVIRLYGTIDADGGHASHTPGTGGSIWLTAADLAGGGKITASMGTTDNEDYRRSSGGRIALYKTSSEGWENFKWTVVCSGFDATGSYYRQDASGNGELYLNQAKMSSGSVGGTEFPMADDLVGSSARNAYRNVAVILGDRTTLCITNTQWQAGSTVCVRDINLVASGAKIDCLGSTIKITSQEHRNGAGWTGGDFQSRLDNGTITLRTGGAILWPMGFSIKIR